MDDTAARTEQAVSALWGKLEALAGGFYWVLPNLLIGALVFALFLAASWAAQRGVALGLARAGRADLGVLLGGFARWATVVVGGLVFATIVFPSVKPADLLGTLGVGSIAVGFAFRDILQNWLSGLLILYRQPFRRGDQIVSGAFEGTVERVEARATLLRTYDGQRVVVPNSDIYTRAITVRTAFPLRRSEHDLGIGASDDPDAACEVALHALRGVAGVAADPPPEAFAFALADSGTALRLFWWTDSHQAEVLRVRGRVVAAVRAALRAAGVDLPYPTRVVLFHDQTEETDGDRARQREGWPAPPDGEAPAPRPLGRLTPRRRPRAEDREEEMASPPASRS